MQTLSIEATSSETADKLCAALVAFGAEIVESEAGKPVVCVALAGGSDELVALLNAVRRYVEAETDRGAVIELDGQSYLMDALPT